MAKETTTNDTPAKAAKTRKRSMKPATLLLHLTDYMTANEIDPTITVPQLMDVIKDSIVADAMLNARR